MKDGIRHSPRRKAGIRHSPFGFREDAMGLIDCLAHAREPGNWGCGST